MNGLPLQLQRRDWRFEIEDLQGRNVLRLFLLRIPYPQSRIPSLQDIAGKILVLDQFAEMRVDIGRVNRECAAFVVTGGE